jgi:hypothetical protein
MTRADGWLEIAAVFLQTRFHFLGKLRKFGQSWIEQRLVDRIGRRGDAKRIPLVIGRLQLLLEKLKRRLLFGGAPECRSYELAGDAKPPRDALLGRFEEEPTASCKSPPAGLCCDC